MTEHDSTAIRRHPDGSIDTTHYIARGREARSSAFAENGNRLLEKAGKAFFTSPVWLGAIVMTGFFSSPGE